MKHILITTIAAVVLVGCGESKQSSPPAEAKPVKPVAEVAQPEQPPEPQTAKAPNILIADVAQPVNPMADRAPSDAAKARNIEALKQYLADGAGCVDLRGLLLYPQPT